MNPQIAITIIGVLCAGIGCAAIVALNDLYNMIVGEQQEGDLPQ